MLRSVRKNRLSDQLAKEEVEDKVHALEIWMKQLHIAHISIL